MTKECNRRVCEGSLMITQQWFSQNIWLHVKKEVLSFHGDENLDLYFGLHSWK